MCAWIVCLALQHVKHYDDFALSVHYQTYRQLFLQIPIDRLYCALYDSSIVNAPAGREEMTAYQDIIASALGITHDRAILVEAYLRLQYSTLGNLSEHDMRREYTRGGISATIDADPAQARSLARSYGLQ